MAVTEDGHVLGAELEQCLQGAPGPSLGTLLEVAAGQQERGHARGSLEVDVPRTVGTTRREVEGVHHAGHPRRTEEERVERPAEGRQRAE